MDQSIIESMCMDQTLVAKEQMQKVVGCTFILITPNCSIRIFGFPKPQVCIINPCNKITCITIELNAKSPTQIRVISQNSQINQHNKLNFNVKDLYGGKCTDKANDLPSKEGENKYLLKTFKQNIVVSKQTDLCILLV